MTNGILCYLDEARMKVVGMLYHMRRINPLGIDMLFIQLNACFSFISQMNCCCDKVASSFSLFVLVSGASIVTC
jgi:hypothetical protein